VHASRGTDQRAERRERAEELFRLHALTVLACVCDQTRCFKTRCLSVVNAAKRFWAGGGSDNSSPDKTKLMLC
jgi:hypothetical protein